jgi:hypothetical protein
MTIEQRTFRPVMTQRVPWFVQTSLASVTLILAGTYWDISWHMTVGRDTFWTPAHVAIQLGGLLAGVVGIVLVLSTTLRQDAPLRAASIRVFGFRGPFGAFVAAWGAAAMVVSAPFDDWWHAAYGLDVKILSPPHVVLSLGILGVAAGGMALVLASLNRAGEAPRWVLLVLGGELLVLLMTSILEHTFRANLHRADAYRAMGILVPGLLLALAGVAGHRWAATALAATYTAFMLVMLWVFPLFPAEPKLGPVYQPITHFVPLEFPMLIVAPAIAIDLVRARVARQPVWGRAILLGAVFLLVLVAVEWPFATFLQSPASHGRFFATQDLPYFMAPDWHEANGTFLPEDEGVIGMLEALVAAVVSSGVGLTIGDAMRSVRR